MTNSLHDQVTLSGIIDDAGRFTFRRADPATDLIRGSVPNSDYHCEVLDVAGRVIDRRPAVVRAYRACHSRGLKVTATARFSPNARIVRLRNVDRVLWEASVLAAPRVNVSLEGVPSREAGVTLGVSVDSEAEPTYTRVVWQRDNEADSEPIVVAPARPFTRSPHVDLSWAPGGTGRLVLTVGTGVRVASARSESFALPPLGTFLSLHQPADGSHTQPGCSVLATAGVVDRDSPEVSSVATDVEWLVDERVAGSGLQATLPAMTPGRHTVTVRLTAQPTTATSVVLTVDDTGTAVRR